MPVGLSSATPPPCTWLCRSSIERVDFGEEDEEKVAVMAEVRRGHAEWKALPLRPRPFVTIRVTADETDPLEAVRSEEHTSELQSPCTVVCRLLLEQRRIAAH